MKRSTRISYIIPNLIAISTLLVIACCINSLGEEKALFIGRILFSLSFCIAMFYSAIKRGFFHENFDGNVGGGSFYKTGRHVVTYDKSSNTATVEEETKYSGGYNWFYNLIILLYHASMVMFFGLILAFIDRKIQKDESDSGGLKIIKLIAIYYFRFLVICCGTGLSLFCLSFAFFGIIIIASIILFVVIKRGIKV